MAGMRGSKSSASFSLHRNLSVEPLINSFGCCRSCKNRRHIIPSHTTNTKDQLPVEKLIVLIQYNVKDLKHRITFVPFDMRRRQGSSHVTVYHLDVSLEQSPEEK